MLRKSTLFFAATNPHTYLYPIGYKMSTEWSASKKHLNNIVKPKPRRLAIAKVVKSFQPEKAAVAQPEKATVANPVKSFGAA